MKKICLVIPCYNESENIEELYRRLIEVFKLHRQYIFEVIFIDNSSQDDTVKILKDKARLDSRVKIIINNRNYGHIRSPYWGMLQASGDAVINMVSDLQDPPELISKFIEEWELGWTVVYAVKPNSKTGFLMRNLRKIYYRILDGIADVDIIKDATGFGLYDRRVLNKIKEISDPYPYLRGLVCELGYPIKTIQFNQPRRFKGLSKNNFYTLLDMAMLGFISHSLVPIRIVTIVGVVISSVSFITAIVYLALKIIYWNNFSIGLAPIIISFSLMFGFLFIFMGVIGEYIGSIHTYVRNRPIVIEKERVNF